MTLYSYRAEREWEREGERGAMGFDPREGERVPQGGRGLGWLWGRGSL